MESAAERTRASEAGLEAKADIVASKQGKTWHSRIGGLGLITNGEMRLMGHVLWKFQPRVSAGP